ncbi:MAG: tRNA uridine-5-carboxymethylaminomethyl(34) synthesis GTPase MnmE [Marinifilaceae bacterium]|jgi:tRNA modification GTPase|nr:tRNA uridine-5-carboxymethylaminomethyl(34) synthesis GTPase MnmE [Marinifilaceae bacterium]
MIDQRTICAIATASGSGAIAVIRLSGKESIAICDSIFKSASGKRLSEQKANTIHFGQIVDGEELIDEVLVSIFKAPHSYTGEESIEISCHAASYIQQRLLNLLINKGARLANPGEFTQRAFLNGKMDLSQAEAVADLIASSSAAAHKVAMQQMKGGFSNELRNLREKLLRITSLVELELDFSEEDVEFADRTELLDLAKEIHKLVDNLIGSFSLGNAIKNGLPVAIVGNPNVGKSTLLNSLLREEKAIVSDIEGTTRDAIEDTINLKGITFRFIDTAGIRKTEDVIENLGIEKTFAKIKNASIVLLLLDAENDTNVQNESIARINEALDHENQKFIIVLNKIDKIDSLDDKLSALNTKLAHAVIPISAKRNENTDRLVDELVETVNLDRLNDNDVIVTNARHYEALCSANEAVERVVSGLEMQISGDFLSQDIREVLHFLGSITGEINTDEILGNIFRNFCIGK